MNHLTTKQLAARWSLAAITLSTWRIKGTGPSYIKVGQKVLYPIAEILDWERRLQTNTAQKKKWAPDLRPMCDLFFVRCVCVILKTVQVAVYTTKNGAP